MANKIKGLTVEIGGDTTKLGKALDDVNKRSVELSGELKDINKLLKLDPGNADALAQKQKVLAEAIANTGDKLKTLKEAEQQVQKQFERGEVSEAQVRALQREIVATESKMKSYENEAERTSKEVKNLGKNSVDLNAKLEKTGQVAKKVAQGIGTMAGAIGAGATAAIAGLSKASVEAAGYADDILTTSTVTGVATDKLQAYSYAAELVDVSVETMTKSMAKNIKSMDAARDGSVQYLDAYNALGISIQDANGNLRDSETVYWETIDALGKMENETERDALAMQLFGKSAQELNPLIEAGSEKMKELTEEAKEVGAVMGEDALNALGSFDDSLQRLKGSANASKNALGGVLLPELQLLTDTGTDLISDFTSQLNESGGGLEGLVDVVGNMSGQIGSTIADLATQLLDKIVTLLPSVGAVAVSLVSTLATTLVSMIPTVLDTAVALGMTILDGLTQAIPLLTQAIVDMIPSLVSSLVSGIPQLISGAVSLFLAIVDAIPILITALVPQLGTIIVSIINALVSASDQLMQGALQLLFAIIDAIPFLIDSLIPQLGTVIEALINGLLSNTGVMLNASIQLFMAIVKAIPKICVSLLKALPQVWTTIRNVLSSIPSKIMGIFNQVLGKVGTWGRDLASKGRSAAKELFDSIVDKIKGLPDEMLSIGTDLVKGLWNGIKDMTSWVTGKIEGFSEDVLDGIKDFFGIHSPSRETAWMGKMLAEGLAEGVIDNADKPLDAMNSLADDMLNQEKALSGLNFERNLNANFGVSAQDHAGGLMAKLDNILSAIERGQILTIDGDALVGGTLSRVDRSLGQREILAMRGAL